MQILFLDESGTPPKAGQQEPKYFVMGGVIIPEDVWRTIRDAVLGMKIRRKIRGEMKWRYFSPANVDVNNPMRHLNQVARDEIREELYSILTKQPRIKSIAAICAVKAAYKMPSINDQQGIYNLTFKVLTERFQYYLQDLSHDVGSEEFGLIICDHRGHGDDKRLRAHHQMLVHSTAAFTSKYPNLVESLLLQPSNLSVGVQFADMVAGAVWRKYERDDERWLAMMEPSLRRSRGGNVEGYGLIKVPKVNWETPSETVVSACKFDALPARKNQSMVLHLASTPPSTPFV